ncbi:MAG: hypothetical protein GY701_02600 [Sulfitobacter sp.]|nr:hypothetical protein [Sulfitobacter sp.]
MGHIFPELPKWEFTVTEVGRSEYLVLAIREGGIKGEAKTTNPDEAIESLRAWAAQADADVASLREYKAIVWRAENAGERVAVRAPSAAQAERRLRAKYGRDATISIWNEDDASRPR